MKFIYHLICRVPRRGDAKQAPKNYEEVIKDEDNEGGVREIQGKDNASYC